MAHSVFEKCYSGRREAAIVSPFAGTTRDVLEISLDIGGYPVILCDTAGLRATEDPIEKEGLKRAKVTASMADLVIIVVDPSKMSTLESCSLADFIDDQCSQLKVHTGRNHHSIWHPFSNSQSFIDSRSGYLPSGPNQQNRPRQ